MWHTINRLCALSILAATLLAGALSTGALTPPGPPEPTMKTLQEIYDKQGDIHQLVDVFIPPGSLSDTTTVVNAGYYPDADLADVDPDLTAENIRGGVAIFGIGGTYVDPINAYAPRTGQTRQYIANDDGALQRGEEWPTPRFIDHGDGTATDNMTGLIWLKDADVPNANRTWAEALDDVAELNSSGTMNGNPAGDASNGGRHQTDWRLPNVLERHSLINYGNVDPPLPDGHPFVNLQLQLYWTSTTVNGSTNQAWSIGNNYGGIHPGSKTTTRRVWPVRGGL